MSHSVSPRPLSYVPFFVADGVLLLTALLIAWQTPEALSGGALVGVVICTCLGALLMAVPFVLIEARRREVAVEKRQRELLDLVTTTTATASHWGAQWAAAATGLGDAAGLAARNLAAAERLPATVQEKIDAFATRMERLEETAQAREERAVRLEEGARLRMAEAAEAASELARVLSDFERARSGLREQHDAMCATLAEFPAAAAKADEARRTLDELLAAAPTQISSQLAVIVERTTSEWAHLQSGLREQEETLSATLAGFPAAVAKADASRDALAELLVSAPAQISAQLTAVVERTTSEWARLQSGLREQQEALSATLAGFPDAVANADASRGALAKLLAAAPAQISSELAASVEGATAAAAARIAANVECAATDAGARLATQVDSFAQHFAKLEIRLDALAEGLKGRMSAVALPIEQAPVSSADAVTPDVAGDFPAPVPLVEVPAPRAEPVMAVVVTSALPPEKPVQTVSKDSIMDPFYIPDNGYSALADAMDAEPSC